MGMKYDPLTASLFHTSTVSSTNTTAEKLSITRKLTGTGSKGNLVRTLSSTHVSLGDPSSTREDADVLGMLMEDGVDEQDVDILIMGVLGDSSFSTLTQNAPIFLGASGVVTDVVPVSPAENFKTLVGRYLGGNEIFLSVQPPMGLS